MKGRDDNASVNIEQAGLKVGVGHTHDSKRTGSACKTSNEAVCGEPSTRREYVQR